MPKKLYQPMKKEGRELLWMDWQQSRDRSVCRGDPYTDDRIDQLASRFVRPFDKELSWLKMSIRQIVRQELKAAKVKTKIASTTKKKGPKTAKTKK